jgi:hypothetical protein
LVAEHWFYLYIVWFYPLLLVALSGTGTTRPNPAAPGPSPARSTPPAPTR